MGGGRISCSRKGYSKYEGKKKVELALAREDFWNPCPVEKWREHLRNRHQESQEFVFCRRNRLTRGTSVEKIQLVCTSKDEALGGRTLGVRNETPRKVS